MLLVVGGGVAGIVSAILLQKKFGSVCLIEKANKLGGLYCSKSHELGVSFDYGSHFIRSTGNHELDKILLGNANEADLQKLGNLKGGSYYGSVLNNRSPFIDARQLPQDVYQRGILEILNTTGSQDKFNNLKEQLTNLFGPTFCQYIFSPILEEKFFGCSMKELSVDGHLLLGLNRILAFTPDASEEIKKSELYDQKFGYHSFDQGVSDMNNFYPKNGGMETWINFLKKSLLEAGAKVLTGIDISQIKHDKKKITSITLISGETISCDYVYWTIAPKIFLKLSNLPAKRLVQSQNNLHTILFDFIIDQPFLTDVHYVQCHEASLKTFRVTLYPNIQKLNKDVFHLTSEVISPNEPDIEHLQKEVFLELIQMGVISSTAKLLYQHSDHLKSGFLMPTPEIKGLAEKDVEIAQSYIENISFLGKSAGNHFAMGGVLLEAFNTINAYTQN